jgi:hypothetical protein
VFFVVAKTMYKNSSGSIDQGTLTLEEVASATSSYVSRKNTKKESRN